MKQIKKKVLSVAVMLNILAASIFLLSWGTWGHQHINHAAVFALPDSMRYFFYNHIDYITEEAVMPDIRKYTINDKPEFARHFINLEAFQTNATDSLPLTMKEAITKYDAAFLDKNGILPWNMIDVMDKLTTAFRNKRKAEILFLAADLGHYLGDANMPLHTSLNHDGGLTDQKGIHALWESQLPEQFGDAFKFYTGKAVYIKDITTETWRIVLNSHHLADTLLLSEKKMRSEFGDDKMYKRDAAGNIIRNKFNQPVFSRPYLIAYQHVLKGMVEKQLQTAIACTANYWYTAWVNAGKPNITDLDPPSLTKRNSKNYAADYSVWKTGKLTGFKVDREF